MGKIPNFCIFPLLQELDIFSIFPELGAEVLYGIPKFLEPFFPIFPGPFVPLNSKLPPLFYTRFVSYFF